MKWFTGWARIMIFADTSFWVAWNMSRDRHFQEADALVARYADSQLVVTNHIVGETWTFLRNKVGHRSAVAYLNEIETSRRVQVAQVSTELEATAWSWLRKHNERAYSFVDATSFAMMRSMKIREALAFDGDFTAAGFTELRA